MSLIRVIWRGEIVSGLAEIRNYSTSNKFLNPVLTVCFVYIIHSEFFSAIDLYLFTFKGICLDVLHRPHFDSISSVVLKAAKLFPPANGIWAVSKLLQFIHSSHLSAHYSPFIHSFWSQPKLTICYFPTPFLLTVYLTTLPSSPFLFLCIHLSLVLFLQMSTLLQWTVSPFPDILTERDNLARRLFM